MRINPIFQLQRAWKIHVNKNISLLLRFMRTHSSAPIGNNNERSSLIEQVNIRKPGLQSIYDLHRLEMFQLRMIYKLARFFHSFFNVVNIQNL